MEDGRGAFPSGPQERLIRSLVMVAAERGLGEMTVADVVAHAGVSKATFYQHFNDKRDALRSAYGAIGELLLARVAEAFERDEPWPRKVFAAIEAVLADFASAPELARMATVEVPSADPELQALYRENLQRFMPYLHQGYEYSQRGEELPSKVDLMAAGAAEAIVFDEIIAGRAGHLPEKAPEILFAVLVPYLGPEQAVEEMRAAAGGP